LAGLESFETEQEEFPWRPVERCASGHFVELASIPDDELLIGIIRCTRCGDELDFNAIKRRWWVYFEMRQERHRLQADAENLWNKYRWSV